MEKKFPEAIYPAYIPASKQWSAEELAALHAACIIEASDSEALYSAAKRAGVPIPHANTSARVTRRRKSPGENMVVVRASAKFFEESEKWWAIAQPFDSQL